MECLLRWKLKIMQLLTYLRMETVNYLGTVLPYYLLSFLRLYKCKALSTAFYFFLEKGYQRILTFFGLEMLIFPKSL